MSATLCRYDELKEIISEYYQLLNIPVDWLLTPVELQIFADLLSVFKSFAQCSGDLQSETCPMFRARDWFDEFMLQYPLMVEDLKADSKHVRCPDFDDAIIAIQRSRDEPSIPLSLTDAQLAAVQRFRIASPTASVPASSPPAPLCAAERAKKRRLEALSTPLPVCFPDLGWIQFTSDVVERCFSKSGLIFTDSRKSLKPGTLEMLLMLKVNTRYWDCKTVEDVCVNALPVLPAYYNDEDDDDLVNAINLAAEDETVNGISSSN